MLGIYPCCRHVKVKVKVTQSCLTLYDPVDHTVHGILQARILRWVAFLFPGDLPNGDGTQVYILLLIPFSKEPLDKGERGE